MITLPPVVSGCSSNNDCPDYTACEARKCINPCAKPNVCAPAANCKVTRHRAICTCPDGYVGSPEVSCTLRKILIFFLQVPQIVTMTRSIRCVIPGLKISFIIQYWLLFLSSNFFNVQRNSYWFL